MVQQEIRPINIIFREEPEKKTPPPFLLPRPVVISPEVVAEMSESDFLNYVLTGLKNGTQPKYTDENKQSGDGNPVGELEGRCPYLF